MRHDLPLPSPIPAAKITSNRPSHVAARKRFSAREEFQGGIELFPVSITDDFEDEDETVLQVLRVAHGRWTRFEDHTEH